VKVGNKAFWPTILFLPIPIDHQTANHYTRLIERKYEARFMTLKCSPNTINPQSPNQYYGEIEWKYETNYLKCICLLIRQTNGLKTARQMGTPSLRLYNTVSPRTKSVHEIPKLSLIPLNEPRPLENPMKSSQTRLSIHVLP